MSNIKRETGFYWVKWDGRWIIAEYNSGSLTWEITGSEIEWQTTELDEIDERQIKRL